MRTTYKIATAALAGVLVAGLALPAVGEVVRGRDLMTPEEWQTHRTEMLNAETPAERQAVAEKMQQVLQARAAEKGDILASETTRPMMRFGHGPGFGPRAHPGWGPCWVR